MCIIVVGFTKLYLQDRGTERGGDGERVRERDVIETESNSERKEEERWTDKYIGTDR